MRLAGVGGPEIACIVSLCVGHIRPSPGVEYSLGRCEVWTRFPVSTRRVVGLVDLEGRSRVQRRVVVLKRTY